MTRRVKIQVVKYGQYYDCPNCDGGSITRAFNRCIDCGSYIEWTELKK